MSTMDTDPTELTDEELLERIAALDRSRFDLPAIAERALQEESS